MKALTAIQLFMFFFVGGVVGIFSLMLGVSEDIVPIIVLLSGLGALSATKLFWHDRN